MYMSRQRFALRFSIFPRGDTRLSPVAGTA